MSHESETVASAAANRFRPAQHRLRVTLVGLACLAFGLLIWSRLLLATNYPKTAIAEPPAATEQRGATAAVPTAAGSATAD